MYGYEGREHTERQLVWNNSTQTGRRRAVQREMSYVSLNFFILFPPSSFDVFPAPDIVYCVRHETILVDPEMARCH